MRFLVKCTARCQMAGANKNAKNAAAKNPRANKRTDCTKAKFPNAAYFWLAYFATLLRLLKSLIQLLVITGKNAHIFSTCGHQNFIFSINNKPLNALKMGSKLVAALL